MLRSIAEVNLQRGSARRQGERMQQHPPGLAGAPGQTGGTDVDGVVAWRDCEPPFRNIAVSRPRMLQSTDSNRCGIR